MIRTEYEYQEMLKRVDQDNIFIQSQAKHFLEMGFTEEQVNHALEPSLSFHAQLVDEVQYYERIKRGDFEALTNLSDLGRFLIGLRIYRGISQSELARQLNVSEAQVSRDERNEYHGISVEKAQKIISALDITLETKVKYIPPLRAAG